MDILLDYVSPVPRIRVLISTILDYLVHDL
jgi:hypothetical protein